MRFVRILAILWILFWIALWINSRSMATVLTLNSSTGQRTIGCYHGLFAYAQSGAVTSLRQAKWSFDHCQVNNSPLVILGHPRYGFDWITFYKLTAILIPIWCLILPALPLLLPWKRLCRGKTPAFEIIDTRPKEAISNLSSSGTTEGS